MMEVYSRAGLVRDSRTGRHSSCTGEDRAKTQISSKKAKGAMWMLQFRSFDS